MQQVCSIVAFYRFRDNAPRFGTKQMVTNHVMLKCFVAAKTFAAMQTDGLWDVTCELSRVRLSYLDLYIETSGGKFHLSPHIKPTTKGYTHLAPTSAHPRRVRSRPRSRMMALLALTSDKDRAAATLKRFKESFAENAIPVPSSDGLAECRNESRVNTKWKHKVYPEQSKHPEA